jgi:hypothetical protein
MADNVSAVIAFAVAEANAVRVAIIATQATIPTACAAVKRRTAGSSCSEYQCGLGDCQGLTAQGARDDGAMYTDVHARE